MTIILPNPWTEPVVPNVDPEEWEEEDDSGCENCKVGPGTSRELL